MCSIQNELLNVRKSAHDWAGIVLHTFSHSHAHTRQNSFHPIKNQTLLEAYYLPLHCCSLPLPLSLWRLSVIVWHSTEFYLYILLILKLNHNFIIALSIHVKRIHTVNVCVCVSYNGRHLCHCASAFQHRHNVVSFENCKFNEMKRNKVSLSRPQLPHTSNLNKHYRKYLMNALTSRLWKLVLFGFCVGYFIIYVLSGSWEMWKILLIHGSEHRKKHEQYVCVFFAFLFAFTNQPKSQCGAHTDRWKYWC